MLTMTTEFRPKRYLSLAPSLRMTMKYRQSEKAPIFLIPWEKTWNVTFCLTFQEVSERHEAVMAQLMSGEPKNQNIPGLDSILRGEILRKDALIRQLMDQNKMLLNTKERQEVEMVALNETLEVWSFLSQYFQPLTFNDISGAKGPYPDFGLCSVKCSNKCVKARGRKSTERRVCWEGQADDQITGSAAKR